MMGSIPGQSNFHFLRVYIICLCLTDICTLYFAFLETSNILNGLGERATEMVLTETERLNSAKKS